MKWRWLIYAVIGLSIVGGAFVYNRARPHPTVKRMDLDPSVATNRGPHDHEKLGTACLCDPEAEIKQALKDRADYASTHLDLGNRFRARGHYELAVERYQRAAELEPTNAQALLGLGLSFASLGRYDEARKALEKATEADRLFVDPYISLGLLDYREGEFDDAEQRWKAVLRMDPENAYAKTLLTSVPTVERVAVEKGEKTAS